MSGRIIVRRGYDFARRFTFKLDGVVEDLSGATIKASLKNATKTVEMIADTAQTNDGGAAWASGDVILRFAAAATAGVGVVVGDAWIEVAVYLSGSRIPYEDIPVVVEEGYTLS